MKKLNSFLFIFLFAHTSYVVSSVHNKFMHKMFAGAATVSSVGLGLHGWDAYKTNQEYQNTQQMFRHLGIRYTNEVESADPLIIPLTQKYSSEIHNILKYADRVIVQKKIYSSDELVKMRADFYNSQNNGLRKDLKLTWMNHEKGHGVVATKRIAKNTPLGIYAGEVCHTSEIKDYDYAFDSLHMYETPQSVVIGKMQIDAKHAGNITRFINACDEDTEANCRVLPMLDKNKNPQMVYVSTREIKPGEELTIDYGPKYHWKKKRSSSKEVLS